jgi:ADP-heptose:LPS heptosyltransferase
MREKAETDYPMPSLGELYALFEKCSLFAGNDNGPRHMAVAAGIPTLGLFGRTCPSSWTPPDTRIHETVRAPAKKTEKNGNIYDMRDLLPETAIEAADRIIRKCKGAEHNGKKKAKKA